MSNNSSLPFKLMDAEDEMQMMRTDAVKQSLVYEVQGKRTISYKGLKTMYPKWLDSGGLSSKIVIENTYCRLEKDGEEQSTWRWRAQTMIRTECPATETTPARYFETVGLGEKAYMDKGVYNAFGQRTAASIATRNALRAQIPELEIDKMINNVDSSDLQILETTQPQQQQPKPAQVTERPQAPPQQQQQAAPPAQPPQQQQQQLAQASKPEEILATMVCKQCGTPLKKVMKTSNYQGKITTKPQWQNASTGQPHYYPTTQDAEGKMQFRCNVDTSDPEPQTPAANPHNGQEMPKKWCECMICKIDFTPNPTDAFCYCMRCSLPVQPQQAAKLLKERSQ